MSNRNLYFVYIPTMIILMLFGIALLGTAGTAGAAGAAGTADSLQGEYDSLNKNFMEQMKTINSRDAYKKVMEDRQKALESLLAKFGEGTLADDAVLLKGKVLFDLKKSDEAAALFKSLVEKQSPLAPQAKFEQVRLMLEQEKTEEALALFRQVENTVTKDNNFFWVLMEFSFTAPDSKAQEEYAYKFLKAVGKAPEFERFKVMVYDNLARMEQEKGNTRKSIEILEKALTEITAAEGKAELNSALKQYKMVGSAAPEISAETWLNSEAALKLSDLKGKPVIIDFWATWCNPCRRVIPVLVKNYDQYKEKGLVVIGFTRLYGNYSDEQGSKGKVPPEEEKNLIKEFLGRNKITYPIAIADGKTIFEAYGVTGIPTMVLIDKTGKIKAIEVGSGDEAALEKKIKELVE